MGYIYLLGAVASNFAKDFSAKRMSGLTDTHRKAYFFTFLRMSLCLLIATAILAVQGQLSTLAVTPLALGIALLSGCSQAVESITWLLSARKDTLLLIDQHAAHERRLYEEFNAREVAAASQELLIPQLLTLQPRECELVEEWQTELEELGLIEEVE